jgi:hypothetical protein
MERAHTPMPFAKAHEAPRSGRRVSFAARLRRGPLRGESADCVSNVPFFGIAREWSP